MVDVAALATALERRLAEVGTPARAESEKAYLKSDLRFLGASVPAMRGVVKELLGPARLDHHDAVALVRLLWGRGVHECRMAAVEILDRSATVLTPEDAPLIEQLIRGSGTWALVDGLAASVMGAMVAADQGGRLGSTLDRWAVDADFWVRRSALLALLVPLRAGGGDWDRFTRYADAMLDDAEFFIRKAIGWVLRDTARRRPDMVAEWIAPRTGRMSGVTIREAVKPLPEPVRERFLEAYKAGVAAA